MSRAASDRSGVVEIASIVTAVAIAYAALLLLVGGPQQRFDELALGEDTKTLFARIDDSPIHCGTLLEAEPCLSAHAQRGSKPAVLWLGNSQLHGVNQLRDGEENAPPILARRLRERGLDLVAFSQANASLQEHLVVYAYLAARLPLRALILPVVFDDLRESGIREPLQPGLRDPAAAALLERHQVGRTLLAERAADSGGDFAALEDTLQRRVEMSLTDWLKRHWTLWAKRQDARSILYFDLWRVRNAAFGITPHTKRRMIPTHLERNLASLEVILAEAAAHDTQVFLYIAPLRDDVEIPYVEEEYARFKSQLVPLAERHGARLANLEKLVPARWWGMTTSTDLGSSEQIDFMHFQAGGHELLAGAVGELIEREMDGASS